MSIDSRSVAKGATIETDVCVVGAGVAGITLARELAGSGFRLCLLESGGHGPDRATQSLYWGENIGHPYFPLDTTRYCGFGGTSNRWNIQIGDHDLGVRLRPLDAIDFEERDWVPYSGWPFQKADLDPFYERAQSLCQIGPYTYDVDSWEDPSTGSRLPFTHERVKTVIFQFGSRTPFINKYPQEIERAENITTYTYANVVEIEVDKTEHTVDRLRVACLQGPEFWVSAKLFILAMGAIENARLLLLSRRRHNNGIGNQYDLVGRFFMEHPHLWSGLFIPSDTDILDSLALYRLHKVNGTPIAGKLALSEETLRREKILNYVVSIHPHMLNKRSNIAPGYHAVSWPLMKFGHSEIGGQHKKAGSRSKNVSTSLDGLIAAACNKLKSKAGLLFNKFSSRDAHLVFQLNHMSEQAPNPNSRVTLSEEVDPLGRNRVRLDWQLSAVDMRTIVRAQEVIDEELRRAGLGRLQIQLRDEIPPSQLQGGWHHMGTTRMHRDPKKGVVDPDCRVHGISNLFVAGPSIFPTGGYANPVLTIVALGMRLADHIKRLMD